MFGLLAHADASLYQPPWSQQPERWWSREEVARVEDRQVVTWANSRRIRESTSKAKARSTTPGAMSTRANGYPQSLCKGDEEGYAWPQVIPNAVGQGDALG